MTKNQLTIFKFKDLGAIRTARTVTGEALFCLVDVCKCLDITDSSNTYRQICEEFCIPCLTQVSFLDANNHSQIFNCCTEPQLYFVMMRGRSEHARTFRQWIYNEVLPAIYKIDS